MKPGSRRLEGAGTCCRHELSTAGFAIRADQTCSRWALEFAPSVSDLFDDEVGPFRPGDCSIRRVGRSPLLPAQIPPEPGNWSRHFPQPASALRRQLQHDLPGHNGGLKHPRESITPAISLRKLRPLPAADFRVFLPARHPEPGHRTVLEMTYASIATPGRSGTTIAASDNSFGGGFAAMQKNWPRADASQEGRSSRASGAGADYAADPPLAIDRILQTTSPLRTFGSSKVPRRI